MEIPTVEFQPQDVKNGAVEVIELSSVYERSHKLAVNPFNPHRVEFHHLIYIVNVVRQFEDGDFVFTHTDYNFFGPKVGFDVFRFEDGLIADAPTSFYDLFRVEDGKIVEH